MGNILSAAASTKGGSQFTLIIFVVLLFGIFYFLMIRPQRNRQRRVMQVQSSVMVGQRVRTTAGMYGTVAAVDGDDVLIEVAPGVEVRYMKRAIMDVLSDAADEDGVDPDVSADGMPHDQMDFDGEDPAASEPADDAVAEPVAEAGQAKDGRASEAF
jgi:preprotein translocase subunit YajC